jgi:mono/diheme cytochrome c family protein
MSHLVPCALAVLASGCMWEGWAREPTPGLERMIDQPRVDSYEETRALPSGLALQPSPDGTVPHEPATEHAPLRPTIDGLERGRARYEIHCAPCHGIDGASDTPIAEDMALRSPPSLLSPEVIALEDAQIERVIAEGFGLMPSYAVALGRNERVEVADYVRALQLRAGVPLTSLPPSIAREAEEALR